MADASIALNRFGLGGRPGDDPGANARRWLLNQFERYDARPAVITALPPTTVIGTQLADYYEKARILRQQRGPATPPGRAAAPQMQGDAMMGDNAAMQSGAAMAAAPELKADPNDPVAEARRVAARQGRDHYAASVSARASVAVASAAPFAERLVHFWANHFAVSADKLQVTGMSGMLEFEAIRPNLLGSFRGMLHAVERHPAMLLYLDQAQSVGPNSTAGQVVARRANAKQQQRLGINENLAREIMELHTLGVRTVYTQADVTEFARAMTGWTVNGLGRQGNAARLGTDGTPGTFVFAERLHEPGARTILGQSWAEPGEKQAGAVLDHLAAHPATARHIATKLARHFAGDEPPPTLVAKLETAFLKSNGDLPTVYRALVEAPECWTAQPVKFKSPWDWTVSAMRALGSQDVRGGSIQQLLRQLGQPVWQPGSPSGWEDVAGTWAGPDAIMRRVEAAERMAQRTRDTIDARARAAELFPAALSDSTTQAIARAESPGQGVALMLVAPEFMRR